MSKQAPAREEEIFAMQFDGLSAQEVAEISHRWIDQRHPTTQSGNVSKTRSLRRRFVPRDF